VPEGRRRKQTIVRMKDKYGCKATRFLLEVCG